MMMHNSNGNVCKMALVTSLYHANATRFIPCYVCHNTGGIFFLLKQHKIPILTLNSSKHPTRFCSGSFQTFCITNLKFTPAIGLQECLEKVLCISHQQKLCFPQNDQRGNTLFSFKKDLPIALYQAFGKNAIQKNNIFSLNICLMYGQQIARPLRYKC